MISMIRRLFRKVFPLPILPAPQTSTPAAGLTDAKRENLMAVVRESVGANKRNESLVPFGKFTAVFADGRQVKMEMPWWQFIGDLQIRFVFDGEKELTSASLEDLKRLGLADVDEALVLAMTNLKRAHGEPTASPWSGGLMVVNGEAPDFDSSYLLDRSFWRSLLQQHADGVVVAVPKRGGLLYTPLSDQAAVAGVRKGVVFLYSSSGDLRVSSALYLFKNDEWSIFQPPVKR